MRFYKHVFLISSFVLLLFIAHPSLNPLDNTMFDFHDLTQAGRVGQFALNLREGQMPPRLAPEFSFNQGFPLFNFYAPFAYWVTTSIHLLGVSVMSSLKLSFFLAFTLSFFTMFAFLRRLFNFLPSLLGATLYVTSTYFATEIVIRGNLAETWYLALLPLALSLLMMNSEKFSRKNFFFATIILFFTFTVHNVFSLLSVALFTIFSLLLPNKKINLVAIVLSLLLGSYFLLPALTETPFIQINSLIKGYNYQDHFLCPWQLWSSNGWHFGSSMPGCDSDLMSFKLGKLNLILGALGFLLLLYRSFRQKENDLTKKISIFMGLLFVSSLFLTLSYSKPFWDSFSPVMALFQFPWRFLVFGMVEVAFFGAYLFHYLKLPFKSILIVLIILASFVTARKYLIKPMYSYSEYNAKYNSKTYIAEELAYMMPEYISSNTDYSYWSIFDPAQSTRKRIDYDYKLPVQSGQPFIVEKNGYFEKQVRTSDPAELVLNIQYFPYWKVLVDNEEVVVAKFDKLGRPVLRLNKPAQVRISYEQTPIEQTGNMLSIIGLILLGTIVYRNKFI